jgi:predicted permease
MLAGALDLLALGECAMHNVILLILCLAIGVALRWFGRVPDNAHTTLNTFIIYVAFPALILVQVHGLHLDQALLFSVLMPWLMFVIGAALFWAITRCLNQPPTTTGALMLTGGLGNTSLLEAAMGPQIGGAIVASQYGLNPALVTLMVGAGTLLAFMTASCWWQLLTLAAR